MPKKPPGRCIFCNGFGLTDEHVLPDSWMRRIFPRTPLDQREEVRRLKLGGPEGWQPPSRTINVRQGSIFSKWLHVVCKKCNNGWMHDLEDENGPLLLRLIRGTPGALTAPGQRLLATWLAKTVMVAEYFQPEDVTFSADERSKMREKLEIPLGCQMWIGTTTGTQWRAAIEHVSCHDMTLFEAGSPNPPPIPLGDAQVTFFGLNTFLAVVFSSSGRIPVYLNQNAKWRTGLKQIWPVIDVAIRLPMFPLRDEEVDAALGWFESFLHPPLRPAPS